MTIQQVQQQMGDNLKRWYPFDSRRSLAEKCERKVTEEHNEWKCQDWSRDFEGEECADIVIALCGYCSQAGIDLQAEIEKKLAIVSARKDQAERDKARGIG
jgi:Zn finger protein HypA/HybF involved in hydrogenase expression